MPQRIQRKRTKGWRMPEGAVYVGRPTQWGNPFTPDIYYETGYSGNGFDAIGICVQAFRSWLCGGYTQSARLYVEQMLSTAKKPSLRGPTVDQIRAELRGKDLACWCPLGQPCHADVLLELANQ